jgi:hypothetical protein
MMFSGSLVDAKIRNRPWTWPSHEIFSPVASVSLLWPEMHRVEWTLRRRDVT